MKKIMLVLLLFVIGIMAFAQVKEGKAAGFKDDIHVTVEMKAGKIVSIKAQHQDTKRIAEPAIEKLTKDIIAAQSTEVDDVAGATYTSKGFKQAVANAIGK